MASQALYRRYRSQTFNDLVGQEHIVQTLRNALVENRIAHAYLFTGPRGVGKTSVARLLAKAVNCTEAPNLRPCGVCESCVSVADGRAVDVIEMDAASHTSVEDAREIIERVQFRPSSGAYKVYIIDEVHMLSTAAFNALLKTLEEPPPHALFILATTENHKVPATILSRCQRFTFNRHTVTATVARLQHVAAAEGFALEPGVAESIARAATGSMRDALSVLDQLMAYGGTTISLGQVQNLLGATEAQEVMALIDALIAGDVSAALHALAGVADQGADLRQFARDLVERLRALMLLKAGGDSGLIDASDDELQSLQAQAQAAELGALLQWVKLYSSLDYQIRTSAIPQLPLEMATIEALTAPAPAAPRAAPSTSATRPAARPSAPPPAAGKQPAAAPRPAAAPAAQPSTPPPSPASPAPAQAAPVEPQAVSQSQPVPTSPPSAAAHQPASELPLAAEPAELEAPAAEAPSLTPTADFVSQDDERFKTDNAAVAALEHIESIWPDIIRDVRVYNKMLQALLMSGVHPVDVQDTTVVLGVANEFLFGRLDQPQLRQIVERVINKLTGTNYSIRCVVEAQHRENPNILREQIRNSRKDPLVKAAINIFDADIVAVKLDE